MFNATYNVSGMKKLVVLMALVGCGADYSNGPPADAGIEAASDGAPDTVAMADADAALPVDAHADQDMGDALGTADVAVVDVVSETTAPADAAANDGPMCASDANCVTCPNTSKYATEATGAVASGSFVLCLSGACPAADCCYPYLSPGPVCVAQ
jgi:hypothetical protein